MSNFLGVEPPSVPPHVCDRPLWPNVANWTVWRCDCGLAYRLEPFDPGHDVQPGDGRPVSWRRYPIRDLLAQKNGEQSNE